MTDTFTRFAYLAALPDQSTVMDYASEHLTARGYTVERGKRWMILTPPTTPHIAMVAHCDTVADCAPNLADIQNRYGTVSVRGGGVLGADDRAGVLGAILAAETATRPPLIILTQDEEIGCQGAGDCAIEYTPPRSIRLLVQLDRRGHSDFVTYDCESKPLNKFCRRFGFVAANGSFSDISKLGPAWGIAAVNLSTGYYDEHTRDERLVLPQFSHTVSRAIAMIDNPPKKRLAYVERPRPVWTARDYQQAWKTSTWPDGPVYKRKELPPIKIEEEEEYLGRYTPTEFRCDECGYYEPIDDLHTVGQSLICEVCYQRLIETTGGKTP